VSAAELSKLTEVSEAFINRAAEEGLFGHAARRSAGGFVFVTGDAMDTLKSILAE
jgi:hypothetical protein